MNDMDRELIDTAAKGESAISQEKDRLKKTRTYQNLVLAFSMESQACTRYDLFKKIAQDEGQEEIAGLFEETADSERAHAVHHLQFLKYFSDPITGMPIGSTRLNLLASIQSESHEYTDLYPAMVKTAREEGFEEVADWFETLSKAERSHAGKFEDAMSKLGEADA